jgi:hypothetical protein
MSAFRQWRMQTSSSATTGTEKDSNHSAKLGSADYGQNYHHRMEFHPLTHQSRIDHVVVNQPEDNQKDRR